MADRVRTRRKRTPPRPERRVCLVSLGCSKALVDSEVMAGHLGRAGLALVTEPTESDLVVVNTCGFIGEARQESLDVVHRMLELKRSGQVRGVVVTGCLVQLAQPDLAAELRGVDALLPLSDYSGVPSIVREVLGDAASEDEAPGRAAAGAGLSASRAVPGGLLKEHDTDLGRALLTSPHTAYLRLGEGCNHICAFCAIPKIRGKLKSKPLEVLVEEAAALESLGARELTLIAEDSTDWAKDLRRGYDLADLLVALGERRGVRWVRVMYAHPATIDDRLIETMARVPNVAPYLDMPVQHGDEAVLRAMRRGTGPQRIRDVVGRLRAAIPGITLRTTILVGFPGETEEAFGRLVELLEELRFDRVGCFVFSPEPTTEGWGLRPRVSREVAEQRRATVMALQRRLLEAGNRARIGRDELVLVDAVERPVAGSGRLALARAASDAPEVDGRVLVELPPRGDVRAGDLLTVRITGVRGYDLLATAAPDAAAPDPKARPRTRGGAAPRGRG